MFASIAINTRLLHLAGLCLLTTIFSVYADGITAQDYAEKYYTEELNAPSSSVDGRIGLMMSDFPQVVPVSLQSEVLDRMLDKACFAASNKGFWVIIDVLKYMEGMQNVTVGQRFDEHLSALAKDPNWSIRREVLQFLDGLKRDKDQGLILAALSDQKDQVRGAAIDALRGRPNAEAIFQKYIKDHQSDPAYTTSVLYAKVGLRAIHEEANDR